MCAACPDYSNTSGFASNGSCRRRRSFSSHPLKPILLPLVSTPCFGAFRQPLDCDPSRLVAPRMPPRPGHTSADATHVHVAAVRSRISRQRALAFSHRRQAPTHGHRCLLAVPSDDRVPIPRPQGFAGTHFGVHLRRPALMRGSSAANGSRSGAGQSAHAFTRLGPLPHPRGQNLRLC
ncbi:hypothetical protein BC834DRAFT_912698 [Gloeopeniophorella convolvens]|nr:hypothetical protein BC834DRAFT_912698 [Gloeopeniophorella convolvens]